MNKLISYTALSVALFAFISMRPDNAFRFRFIPDTKNNAGELKDDLNAQPVAAFHLALPSNLTFHTINNVERNNNYKQLAMAKSNLEKVDAETLPSALFPGNYDNGIKQNTENKIPGNTGVSVKQVAEQNYQLVKADSYIQSKNYYLLTLFGQLPEVNKLLAADATLSEIAKAKRDNLSSSLTNCEKNANCYLENIKFSELEIQTIGERLKKLYSTQKVIRELVKNHLIPSGCYSMYQDLQPQEMLVKAWEQDAEAVNYAIEVYAGGRAPNYPKIDSISFKVNSKSYPNLLYECTNAVREDVKNDLLFFSPTMIYALRAIEINDRNRAADYEPMESTYNKAAFDRIKTTKWSDYTYSLILVPGAGPDVADEAISATCMLRCRVAAYRWKEGKAPFIMVSGGKVHPYKTKYCEAEEMKKYLMVTMHIPETAILIEPHARHTTTNMRNCARIIFRYGMPMDKPCITSTSKSQSLFITDEVMQQRCIKELGYSPYTNGKRLTETEAEFFPRVTSLQIDADEPMDP